MWKSVIAAMQGSAHIAKGIPCQDKAMAIKNGSITAIALSDGAGTAKLSHFGAECATQATATFLSKSIEELLAQKDGRLAKLQLLSKVQAELQRECEERSCQLSDLACTLLCAAVNEEEFILGHVGDGVIGFLRNGEIKVASHPENGEYGNSTYFITSSHAAEAMKLFKGSVANMEGFVLMSDGTEAALYHKQQKLLTPVLAKIMTLCAILPEARMEMLLQKTMKEVFSKATTDDCSIAFLVRVPEGFEGFHDLRGSQKCLLLDIKQAARSTPKRLKRYDVLLQYLQQPRTLVQVARHLHLKPKLAKRHLELLMRAQLVVQSDGNFKADA